ncbi:MAG: hypothetical protein DMF99_27495 [Acidobacteria bacterium]|nr:MAG: hypothetical protein DMF99_27495 [Acidobacteriota bacterium]
MMGGGEIIASFLDEETIDKFIIGVIPTFIGEGIQNYTSRPSYLVARCSGIPSWATSWARSPLKATSPAADPAPSSPRLWEGILSTGRA